jgi:carbon storage regulator
MLVLSRKPGQSIRVGNGIVITVKATMGGRVKLAIEAPRDVRILRGELEARDDLAAEPDYLTAEVDGQEETVGAA